MHFYLLLFFLFSLCIDSKKNFCSLATGTLEERRIWLYQAQKLISLCSFILAKCDDSNPWGPDFVVLTSLAMRLAVVLTDMKGWKSIGDDNLSDANIAVNDLVQFMGSRKSGLYICVKRYIYKLDIHFSSQNSVVQMDDIFLITASAITLALRPFHMANSDANYPGSMDLHCAAVQYFLFVLTIPWLAQRLPVVLLPALKHESVLSPCLRALVVRLYEI